MNDNTVIFVNPSYPNAIIGYTHDGRAIYEFNKMVEHLVEVDGMDELEAIEFIEFNTLRALPYAGEFAPLVVEIF
jgi:hypothetical protein